MAGEVYFFNTSLLEAAGVGPLVVSRFMDSGLPVQLASSHC